MNYLNPVETGFLKLLLQKKKFGRAASFNDLVEEYLTGNTEEGYGMLVHFLEELEGEGVLRFSNVHISKSAHSYGDMFLIKFFNTLKKDRAAAHEMLVLFELEDLEQVAHYEAPHLGDLLTLIKSIRKKVKLLYFEESDGPFYRQLLDAIAFDIEVDAAALRDFTDAYIQAFTQDELKYPKEVETNYTDEGEEYHIHNPRPYPYETQRLLFLDALKKRTKESGYTNVFFWSDISSKKGFRELEATLAAARDGIIEMLDRTNEAGNFTFNVDRAVLEEAYAKNEHEIKKRKYMTDDDEALYFGVGKSVLKSHYDETTWVLTVNGKEIRIRSGKEDTTQTRLLKTIYTEPRKEWYTDEIWEDWGEDPAKMAATPTIGNARTSLNRKLRKAGLTHDFLEGTDTRMKVNPRYL